MSLRRVRLDGPVNFRDLGGYRTASGDSVRWCQIYRADALHDLSARDVRTVFDELGIALVIDLRSEREVSLVGTGPVGSSGATWVHLPVIDETQPVQQTWAELSRDVPLAERYLRMLDQSGPRFVEALTLIAESDVPLVFHCTAGKDRTGLLAALLLSLLGVPNDEVAHDYALTSSVLHILESRYLARAEDPRFATQFEGVPGWRELARKLMVSDAGTMQRVLGELQENDGSTSQWLHRNGLSAGTMSLLRGRMLER